MQYPDWVTDNSPYEKNRILQLSSEGFQLSVDVLPPFSTQAVCEPKPEGWDKDAGFKINGVSFEEFDVQNGGMGKTYLSTRYQTAHRGRCFQIETLVWHGNLREPRDGESITEFEASKKWQEASDEKIGSMMERLIDSVKFTD